MSILHAKRPDLKLRLKVLGQGDEFYERGLMEQVQREGLQDLVEFVGWIDAARVALVLTRARFSVVPSLWYENLPNAVLESYACGTPVVASRLGSLGECVQHGETGYLFEPDDAASLAETIEHCLDNPSDLAAMAQRSELLAGQVYSPGKHLESLESLFLSLTSGRGQR
jgi:glycosyltransferase involved in cell wall biosynthesis